MSNALLPITLLRPSCLAAIIRTSSVPVTQPCGTATLAFLRHFSWYTPCSLSLFQLHNSPLAPSIPQFHFRSFSSSLNLRASVSKLPKTVSIPSEPSQRKRQVRIGPLPCGELSPTTIESIFGHGVSPADGNGVLRILHHRRVSGSLADYGVDNLSNKFRNMTPELAMRGLEWLRNAFPVDEARAAEEWAEKEANRIAYEIWLSEEQGGKKFENPAKVWREMEEERQKRIYQTGLLHHGPSVMEESIKEKRRKRLEEAAKRAEEKEAKEAKEREMIASGEWVKSPGGTALIKPGQKTYVDIFGREQVDDRQKWTEYYNKKSQTPFKSEEEMRKSNTVCNPVPRSSSLSSRSLYFRYSPLISCRSSVSTP